MIGMMIPAPSTSQDAFTTLVILSVITGVIYLQRVTDWVRDFIKTRSTDRVPILILCLGVVAILIFLPIMIAIDVSCRHRASKIEEEIMRVLSDSRKVMSAGELLASSALFESEFLLNQVLKELREKNRIHHALGYREDATPVALYWVE